MGDRGVAKDMPANVADAHKATDATHRLGHHALGHWATARLLEHEARVLPSRSQRGLEIWRQVGRRHVELISLPAEAPWPERRDRFAVELRALLARVRPTAVTLEEPAAGDAAGVPYALAETALHVLGAHGLPFRLASSPADPDVAGPLRHLRAHRCERRQDPTRHRRSVPLRAELTPAPGQPRLRPPGLPWDVRRQRERLEIERRGASGAGVVDEAERATRRRFGVSSFHIFCATGFHDVRNVAYAIHLAEVIGQRYQQRATIPCRTAPSRNSPPSSATLCPLAPRASARHVAAPQPEHPRGAEGGRPGEPDARSISSDSRAPRSSRRGKCTIRANVG